ncbi:MAG: hypothetical protein GY711_24435 [bacterium]|nr:hypothetical protein [bacterium]
MDESSELPILGQQPSSTGVEPDPELLAEGWVRRNLATPEQVDEVVELYSSLGFEVKAQSLSPTDFEAGCTSCALSACTSYVLVYTRKKTTS